MDETAFDLSLVYNEMSLSDSTVQQQPANTNANANLFMPHQEQEQQPQHIELDAMDFSAEELEAIQEINQLFESAPFFIEENHAVDDFPTDQNLNYLEEQRATNEESFDEESIYYMDGTHMYSYSEFADLDSNNLMMLITTEADEEMISFEMEDNSDHDDDDEESFQRVPAPTSVVSARYRRFPQP